MIIVVEYDQKVKMHHFLKISVRFGYESKYQNVIIKVCNISTFIDEGQGYKYK